MLSETNLTGQTVLLRLDLNIPPEGLDSRRENPRLEAVLPTIQWLINRQNRLVILSHLGRPKGIEPALSLEPVYQKLSAWLDRPIVFLPKLFISASAQAISQLEDQTITGLENLRFDPGEENNSRTFASKLAQYGQVYVNDAFASCHRPSASIVALAEFRPRYAGLLVEREYLTLTSLLRHPARPFVVVIGGAKIKDKLPVIRNLLPRVDRILLGGGVANTFLAASGVEVKKSLVDRDNLPVAKELLRRSRGKIILPGDYRWHEDQIFDLGDSTIAQYQKLLTPAKTIFWSGNLGYSERPEFAKSSEALARFMADLPATTIVGGGNTTQMLADLDLVDRMSFVSTGGSATLQLLAGETLPGLKALD